MAKHSSRKHAFWAASATARNLHCPGSLALSRVAPPDSESEAAALGTCAHQVAERCLWTNTEASDQLGNTQTCGRFTFEVTDEIATGVQVYVDYCRSLVEEGDHFWIEEYFSLESLEPPFESGGTGDFIVYKPSKKLLEIVDLKFGKGVVVDVHENAQERSYALGAMLAHQGLDVTHVRSTIVQPRAPHKDGVIRSEIYHVADLAEWTADLLKGMRKAKAALDAYEHAKGNQVLLDEWRDAWLRPGKCQFCPSEGICPALRRDAYTIANLWFDDHDKPHVGNTTPDNSPEALAKDLDAFDMIQDWMNARRVLAHSMAEQGIEIPGYILAPKRGTRKWNEENDAMMALALQETLGWPEDEVFVRKLKSPAMIEKGLRGDAKDRIRKLWRTVISGTNLVKKTKTQRPAVAPIAGRFFEQPQE